MLKCKEIQQVYPLCISDVISNMRGEKTHINQWAETCKASTHLLQKYKMKVKPIRMNASVFKMDFYWEIEKEYPSNDRPWSWNRDEVSYDILAEFYATATLVVDA